ncbi:RnfABCDGE type electron transport complex subunit D [Nioella aestuarii]|uniref:RnfABCDGE type electron transport complex subunit D n=1 Tax=Nioella aestuarii TaxID=1662864 RepID=UPI003D7FE3ED
MIAKGLWSRDMMGWAMAAALLPPAAVVVVDQGVEAVLRMGSVLAVATLWQLLFRRLRGVPWSPSGAVLAVAMAVLAPNGLSPVQLALGASFGIVLADLIFGGWGRNVVGAAPAALAMVFLTGPGTEGPGSETTMLLASGTSAALLLALGILPLPVLVGSVAGIFGVMALIGAPWDSALLAGGAGFGLVMLLADPVCAPTTRVARLAYGLLGGGLIALLTGAEGLAGAERATVFAVLLAQVFAPTIDYAALATKRLARERRHA